MVVVLAGAGADLVWRVVAVVGFEVGASGRFLRRLGFVVERGVGRIHERFDTAGQVYRVAGRRSGNDRVHGRARVQRNIGNVGISGKHVGKGETRVVGALLVPSIGQALGRGKATLEMVGGLKRDRGGTTLVRLCGGLESLRHNVQVVTSSFGLFDSLGRSSGRICRSSVCTRTSPGTLTSGEDPVDHVNPVEEGVDDEHDGVKHDLIAAELSTKVKHEQPVESERDGDETDRQILDLLRGRD